MKNPPLSATDICEYAIADNGIARPLLIDLPHSGRIYPDDFGFACPKPSLELCEELYLDELFGQPALACGGGVVKANFPRTYVDVNRAIDDIDQLLFDKPWIEGVAAKGRSTHGHGVIMRLIRAGEPIYARYLTHDEIRHRLNTYYRPYHALLGYFSDTIFEKFGMVYHLDCHSMPSGVVTQSFPHAPPDFIIGDLDGRSCGLEIRNHIVDHLKDMGYRVAVNQLYKGAEIINRYGQPAWGRHSLQIEINRALFQNESTGEKNKNFPRLAADLQKLIQSIALFQKA